VLSGLIGALLAAGLDPWLAAAAAAHVHSLAGAIAAQNAPTSSSALVHAIPEAIRAIRSLTS
jgi:NAD(P)H-hydrate repair Nnr-like enzyme with NAD(P)H-hydrate dehydratase domain